MVPFKRNSFVNACPQYNATLEMVARWKSSVGNATRFHPQSGQWVVLTRKHAHLVVFDKDLAPFIHEFQPADENYVKSLLVMHSLDNETTCSDGLTHVHWDSATAALPSIYDSEERGNYEAPAKPPPTESNATVMAEYMKQYMNYMTNI